MSDYKYKLELGSKKHRCPSCHKKRYVRYIDIESNEYLPIEYGRCDRQVSCDHNKNPYKDGYAKENYKPNTVSFYKPKPAPKPKAVHFPFDVFEKTYSGYEQNTFIQNLLTNVPFPFDVKDINKIISQYHLGTIKNGYRKGAITFPFIDINKNIRAVQVKQFDKSNNTTGTDFLHSIIEKHHKRNNIAVPEWLDKYLSQDKRVTSLFGEHLLTKYPNNPIALVEAPKTAIYGTLYFGFPDENPNNMLWLAVYNLSSLNFERCKVLKGRRVLLFPDLSKGGHAYNLWSDRAKEFQSKLSNTYFKVSDLLERLAPETDRKQGNDIADFLIKLDWKQFREKNKPKPTTPAPPKKTLKDIASNLVGLFTNCTRKDLIELLEIEKQTTKEKATSEFEAMVKAGYIDGTDKHGYFTNTI